MYLSRVMLKDNQNYRNYVYTNLQYFHKWVEKSFPNEFKENIRTRKLWRLDSFNNKNYLIMLSEQKPDIEMFERNGIKGTAKITNYDQFLDDISENKLYRFKIKYNPVSSVYVRNSKRGDNFICRSDEDKIKYLIDRSDKNGFEVLECTLIQSGYDKLVKDNQKAPINKAVVEGVLAVKDVDKFKEILINGFGKRKAYGYGLMTIVPIAERG